MKKFELMPSEIRRRNMLNRFRTIVYPPMQLREDGTLSLVEARHALTFDVHTADLDTLEVAVQTVRQARDEATEEGKLIIHRLSKRAKHWMLMRRREMANDGVNSTEQALTSEVENLPDDVSEQSPFSFKSYFKSLVGQK